MMIPGRQQARMNQMQQGQQRGTSTSSQNRAHAQHSISTGISSSSHIGVVIVDHGSKKKESNEQLVEFAALYRSQSGMQVVEIAHMEIAEPTIEQAVGKCVTQGVETIVIAPYFLSRGRHIQEDIPALVRAAEEKYQGVKIILADAIGIDPLMAQLIHNRVLDAV